MKVLHRGFLDDLLPGVAVLNFLQFSKRGLTFSFLCNNVYLILDRHEVVGESFRYRVRGLNLHFGNSWTISGSASRLAVSTALIARGRRWMGRGSWMVSAGAAYSSCEDIHSYNSFATALLIFVRTFRFLLPKGLRVRLWSDLRDFVRWKNFTRF